MQMYGSNGTVHSCVYTYLYVYTASQASPSSRRFNARLKSAHTMTPLQFPRRLSQGERRVIQFPPRGIHCICTTLGSRLHIQWIDCICSLNKASPKPSGFAKPIRLRQTHGVQDCKYYSLSRIDFIIAPLPPTPPPAPPERSWSAWVP